MTPHTSSGNNFPSLNSDNKNFLSLVNELDNYLTDIIKKQNLSKEDEVSFLGVEEVWETEGLIAALLRSYNKLCTSCTLSKSTNGELIKTKARLRLNSICDKYGIKLSEI